ncbi:hypothetical protein ACIQCT_21120, partial [Enterobacter cancerogenus]|uniref:hypothetical protein n=1 Tax=Enterobacter cancerogenus TaxID=69218 RepID=UPI00380679BE
RLGIHLLSEDIKNPCHFECPHRLSDKLLKSSAASLFSAARGVHITLPRFRVKRLICFSLLTRRRVPLFRVSGGAL